jgi:hypothetical protein
MDYLHWLLECHRSQQLPLSLQQAHWAELLELEYPLEQEAAWLTSSETSLVEGDNLEEDRLMEEDHLKVEDRLKVEDCLKVEGLLMTETLQIRQETLELEGGKSCRP